MDIERTAPIHSVIAVKQRATDDERQTAVNVAKQTTTAENLSSTEVTLSDARNRFCWTTWRHPDEGTDTPRLAAIREAIRQNALSADSSRIANALLALPENSARK